MSCRSVKQELFDMYCEELKDEHGYSICMLYGYPQQERDYTFHHIDPKRKGGSGSIANGALLCKWEHEKFNFIEHHNKRTAANINDGFMEFKETPTQLILKQLKAYKEWALSEYGYEEDYDYNNENNMYLRKRR